MNNSDQTQLENEDQPENLTQNDYVPSEETIPQFCRKKCGKKSIRARAINTVILKVCSRSTC